MAACSPRLCKPKGWDGPLRSITRARCSLTQQVVPASARVVWEQHEDKQQLPTPEKTTDYDIIITWFRLAAEYNTCSPSCYHHVPMDCSPSQSRQHTSSAQARLAHDA